MGKKNCRNKSFISIIVVILTMIIERPDEVKKIREAKKWVLVYGRRKTGKTFLVENFIHYDEYFFVKKDKSIISKKNSKAVSYDAFVEILTRALQDGKVVVVDEFHRLENGFFDFLHFTKKQGKLILISSTLFLSKRLFSSKSALLGFFVEVPIGLISLKDCIKALLKFRLGKRQLLELSILLKEPIAIEYFSEKREAKAIFAAVLVNSIKTVPALVGEIFVEEERSVSGIYEGILRAVANGKVVSSEISSYLFARKLIKKDDPSTIQQHLNNLVSFGIIKKIGVFGKNRFVYKHVSPLAKVFYYADEKYNVSERKLGEKEVQRIVDELMPRIVEDNVREFLAEKFGLIETIVEAKDYEIDACLLKFKKPEIAVEVKWKKLRQRDIKKAEENLQRINAKKKMLFVQNKKNVHSNYLLAIDVSNLK